MRLLLQLAGGSLAHFRLEPGQTSQAVEHRTVDEIWFVISGSGEIWRSQSGREEVLPLLPGQCLTIPAGTAFQFRADVGDGVSVIGITMPPWTGADEAIPAAGPWTPGI